MKNKYRIIRKLGIMVVLIGVGILLLPGLYQYRYDRNVKKLEDRFEEQFYIDGSPEELKSESEKEVDERLEQLYQLLVKENHRLYEEKQGDLKDPFSYEQPAVDLSQYGINDNIIGFIIIPKIGERLPVYLGANQGQMNQGIVHLTETSYPVGGLNTNAVLAGHRGYSQATMFRNINQLEKGDPVYIKNFREILEYHVAESKVIKPEQIDQVLIREGRDMITLITCNPYGYNYERYVVYCDRAGLD